MQLIDWLDTLRRLLKGVEWRYLWLYVMAVISAGLEVVSIGLVLPLLTEVVGEGDLELLPINIEAPLERLAVWLVMAFILKNLFRFLVEYENAKITNEIRGRWMRELFGKYLGSHYQLFINTKQGKMVHNLFDLTNESLAGVKQLVTLFMYGVSTVIVLIGLLSISLQLTILSVLVLAGLYLGVNRPLVQVAASLGKKRLGVYQEVNALPAEAFRGVREIKTYGTVEQVLVTYKQLVDRMVRIRVRVNFYQLLPAVFPEVLLVAILSGALIYLHRSEAHDLRLLLPLMGTYVYASFRLFTNGGVLLRNILTLVTYGPSMKLLADLLTKDDYPDVKSGDIMAVAGGKNLEIRDVWFGYEKGKDVLKGASLDLKRGEIVAVVGPSGEGKSTLADLLIRMIEPNRGGIFYGGQDVVDFTLDSWRKRIGFISQDTFLFHGTIKENIALSLEGVDDVEIEAAAIAAHAHDFIVETGDGYKTIVGERGARLSGGQRQRIAIARALLRQPDILILDEATSALDAVSQDVILETVKELADDKMVLIITHQEKVAVIADRTINMKDGKLWDTAGR